MIIYVMVGVNMNYEAEKIELKKLFDYYMVLANKRVCWAQAWIADAYFWGWGVAKDYKSFLQWDIWSARSGNGISRVRMMLYYLSLGNVPAAIDAGKYGLNRTVLSTHGTDYPTEVNFDVIYNDSNSYGFGEYIRNNKDRIIDKDLFQVIDEYELGIDETSEYSHYSHGEAATLRAVCYVFGFGVKQDLNKAMEFLIDFDSKLCDDEKRYFYYSSNNDAWHYYCCLEESGVPGLKSLDELWKDKSNGYEYTHMGNDENLQNAYYIRHEIRRALNGNRESASNVGALLLESNNSVTCRNRRIIYHDDRCALSYLKLVAGVEPDSIATYYALELASNADNKAYDWQYAYDLCMKVEGSIDSVSDDREYRPGHYQKSTMIYCLSSTFRNLAKDAPDDVTRDILNAKSESIRNKLKKQTE